MKPLVSVIILTLNSERYIQRCLRSLELQTLVDFEALIVDAGSRDRTHEIVARFDKRFRWLELPGSDMGMARNFGIRQSGGDLITFLDSDDLYLAGKLEAQVAFMNQRTDVEVLYCRALHFRTARTEYCGLKKSLPANFGLSYFLRGNNQNLNTMMMRKELWNRGLVFGEGIEGRYGEEWRLQLAMIVAGVRMDRIEDPLVIVELRPDSHTGWALQWLMKKNAIAEVKKIAGKLNSTQQSELAISEILEEFRVKMVIALVLDGRAETALDEVGSIESRFVFLRMWLFVQSARLLPQGLLVRFLRWAWLARQDRSFIWRPWRPAHRTQFESLMSL